MPALREHAVEKGLYLLNIWPSCVVPNDRVLVLSVFRVQSFPCSREVTVGLWLEAL